MTRLLTVLLTMRNEPLRCAAFWIYICGARICAVSTSEQLQSVCSTSATSHRSFNTDSGKVAQRDLLLIQPMLLHSKLREIQ